MSWYVFSVLLILFEKCKRCYYTDPRPLSLAPIAGAKCIHTELCSRLAYRYCNNEFVYMLRFDNVYLYITFWETTLGKVKPPCFV